MLVIIKTIPEGYYYHANSTEGLIANLPIQDTTWNSGSNTNSIDTDRTSEMVPRVVPGILVPGSLNRNS